MVGNSHSKCIATQAQVIVFLRKHMKWELAYYKTLKGNSIEDEHLETTPERGFNCRVQPLMNKE